ncbi:hypothetical protein [Ekhidna sp.]
MKKGFIVLLIFQLFCIRSFGQGIHVGIQNSNTGNFELFLLDSIEVNIIAVHNHYKGETSIDLSNAINKGLPNGVIWLWEINRNERLLLPGSSGLMVIEFFEERNWEFIAPFGKGNNQFYFRRKKG